MLKSNLIDPALYAELMAEIKKINIDYRTIRKSKEYKIGMLIINTITLIRKGRFAELKRNTVNGLGESQ